MGHFHTKYLKVSPYIIFAALKASETPPPLPQSELLPGIRHNISTQPSFKYNPSPSVFQMQLLTKFGKHPPQTNDVHFNMVL